MAARTTAQTNRVSRQFGDNLASLRIRSGLTQLATAERAGLDRTEISLLERGHRVPRLTTIARVAAGVGAEPADLLAGMAWRLDRRLADEDRQGCFEIMAGHRWEAI